MAKHAVKPALAQQPKKKARILSPVSRKSRAKVIPRAPSPAPPIAKSKGKEKAVDADPAVDSVSSEESLPSTFKIIAGSYEKLLYGLSGSTSLSSSGELEYHLKPIFIFPAHVSCIKAVAASASGGKWLATGSTDEIIKVWDLRRKKEIGGLMQHEGSITHLLFPSRSHLISCSEDGTLCLFRARDWAVLRLLRGHKGRVNSIAVHPSGKVALSVGKDRTMRMWDLMRGKGVASTKLGKEGEIVRFSTDGSLIVVQTGMVIDVYNTDMTLLHTITHRSRAHDALFVRLPQSNEEILLVGAEDKKVSIYDLPKDPGTPPKIVAALVGHENRIKALSSLRISLPDGRKSTTIISTVSSDGKIHIYDLSQLSDLASSGGKVQELEPAAAYDSKGTRLTCVALADDAPAPPAQNDGEKNGKRARDEVSEDEEEEEDMYGSDEDEGERVGEEELEGEEEEEEAESS